MGHRVLSWLSTRRKIPTASRQDNADVTVDVSHNTEVATGDNPACSLRIPLEIWIAIAEIMGSNDVGWRYLVPLAQVCKELRYAAEEALYCRVSVGPHVRQLLSFLHAVCESERRAAAVRALRIRVPMVVFSSVRRTVLQKLGRHSSRYSAAASQAHYSVGAREAGNLSGILAQAFGRLVNLKELDFIDLSDIHVLPMLFRNASFQLTELRATGNALSKAAACLKPA
ncbi:hypothetical protein C8T65DRAFT_77297 [Cerioporus squamosus]|nr:hypothetical protein C8T65DRAFT_77297 [Cerioporus squamosus]